MKELAARGERALLANDKRERSAVQKGLETLERTLKDPKHASCGDCRAQMAWVLYYQTRYGARQDFEALREFAVRALQKAPNDPVLLYLLGNAAMSDGEAGEAISALRRFLALPGTKPEWKEQARNAVEGAQKVFLGSWWRQADFYTNSQKSKFSALVNSAATATAALPQASQKLEAAGQPVNIPGKAQLAKGKNLAEQIQGQMKQGDFQWTPEKEMQLGAQALSSVKELGKPQQDPDSQKYLNDLVMKLVDKSPGPPFQYRVDVLDSDAINAFAVPGAVMVNRGLLRFAENEAELAAVVAHELGHNYGHHMARMMMKKSTAQTAINLLGTALARQAPSTQLAAKTAAGFVANLALLAYNRYEEREADLYATHIAFNAGYNPTYLNSLLVRMFKASPKQPAKFLSKHPPDPERIDCLTRYLESFPLGREMQIDSAEFQRLKARLGVVVPSKGRNKAVEPPLKP